MLACHKGKMYHEGMISGHAGLNSAYESFILLADHELRLGIGLSGLQGPAREKEKREKERSELRDLVMPVTCKWLISLQYNFVKYVVAVLKSLAFVPLICY